MPWTAYCISLIDFGWEYLQTIEEASAKIAFGEAARDLAGCEDNQPGSAVVEFLQDLANARRLADAKGWEGGFSRGHEPRVCWLPAELEFRYASVWKQENNGSTFVVSPYELPWLDDILV